MSIYLSDVVVALIKSDEQYELRRLEADVMLGIAIFPACTRLLLV
jgi:hypothetical protein